MNKSRFLCLLTFLLSVGMLFSQGLVLIKNHPETHIIVNNDYSNNYKGDLKLSFKEADTVVLEIQKDTYAITKKIVLYSSLSYEVVDSPKNEHKLRLRSNIKLENPITLFLDTIKPIQVINASFVDSLDKQQFEFDKVSLLISHLRETGESNENLVKYLTTLEHDFSKWQVLEVVKSENLLQLDHSTISQTFDSDVYKERLKTFLESK